MNTSGVPIFLRSTTVSHSRLEHLFACLSSLSQMAILVGGLKSLYVPVLLSTNPTMEMATSLDPSGFENVAPCETELWTSQSVDEMNNQIPGELPLPCPLP